MTDIKNTLGFSLLVLLSIADLHGVRGQPAHANNILSNQISPPSGLAIGLFSNAVQQNSAFVGWIPDFRAESYILRIYTTSNNVLQRQISNLGLTFQNITELEDGTGYSVTVAGVYVNANGVRIETRESDRISFETKPYCRGGQIWSNCYARCVHKCDDPDPGPVCSRVCVPGCACPIERVIWHDGRCIVSELCPTQTGEPVAVTGLHVFETQNQGTDVVLAWDVEPGAFVYKIRVRLAAGNNRLVLTLEVTLPIARISDLTPGRMYSFAVQAFIRRRPTRGRSALLPPPGIRVENRNSSAIRVAWDSAEDAARYSFVLYSSDRSGVIYVNDMLAGNSIEIDNLASGSDYYFALATAGLSENPGSYSELARVTTLGASSGNIHESSITAMVNMPTTTTRPSVSMGTGQAPCLQKYQSIERFYESNPGSQSGPPYPSCDPAGFYVTTNCRPNDPNVCWCVDPEDGEEIPGSLFGGTNSELPLDCDAFGTLEIGELNLRIRSARTTSIEVEWDAVYEPYNYVIAVSTSRFDQSSEVQTYSVDNAVHSHVISNLISGRTYHIGIYAVDILGASSAIAVINGTTAYVATPEELVVGEKTATSITLSWEVDINTLYFNVRLLTAGSRQVLRTLYQYRYSSVTFDGLDTLTRYIVQVRAVAHQYNSASPDPMHVSEPAEIEVLVQCPLPPLDIIFAFDISQHPTWSGLQDMKNLTAELAIALPSLNPAAPNFTRIAAVKYHRNPATIFNYGRFKKTSNVVGALKYIRYYGNAELNTGRMLKLIDRQFFASPSNSRFAKRDGAVSVVIVFSVGRSQDDITAAASSLKAATNVMSIGVLGRSVDSQLSVIASRPDLKIIATSFAKLREARDIVLRRLCTLN